MARLRLRIVLWETQRVVCSKLFTSAAYEQIHHKWFYVNLPQETVSGDGIIEANRRFLEGEVFKVQLQRHNGTGRRNVPKWEIIFKKQKVGAFKPRAA